ncbi:MAG TPA: hypothetical protein VGK73_39800 [Polyangiaceae bacterium]
MALAASTALIACGDGDDDDDDGGGSTPVKVVKSGEGESCTRTDDCDTDLACYNLVCVDDPTPPTAGTGGGGSGGGGNRGGSSGSGGNANPGRLSGNGESCTKTSDCEPLLSCFNLRCQEAPTGEGGEQGMPPPPALGAMGETCVLTSDCQPTLVCLPSNGTTGSVGVCTPKESGVEATGKTCTAECAEDADCCELPVEEHATLGVKSCTELEALLEGVDCATSVDPLELRRCFALATYCECEDDPWACDDGACVYAADCSATGVVPGGCPEYTRSGMPLSNFCDTEGSEQCRAPASGCMDDDECTMAYVADDPSDTCVEGECVCHSGSCLRSCDSDLDCAAGKICDDDSEVCVPAGSCTSDVACQRQTGDYRATCTDAGICTVACLADIDCNALTGGALVNVCTDGTCQPIGCDSDDECELTTDPVGSRRRMFCATPVAGGAATGSSAITD